MFVVAAGGAVVVKHGNRRVTSSCGSADVLEQLGVDIDLTPEQLHESLKRHSLGFIFARGRSPEEAAGPGLLNEVCEQTGGRHLPSDLAELPDIAAKIGVELRNRYVLGYSPVNPVRENSAM